MRRDLDPFYVISHLSLGSRVIQCHFFPRMCSRVLFFRAVIDRSVLFDRRAGIPQIINKVFIPAVFAFFRCRPLCHQIFFFQRKTADIRSERIKIITVLDPVDLQSGLQILPRKIARKRPRQLYGSPHQSIRGAYHQTRIHIHQRKIHTVRVFFISFLKLLTPHAFHIRKAVDQSRITAHIQSFHQPETDLTHLAVFIILIGIKSCIYTLFQTDAYLTHLPERQFLAVIQRNIKSLFNAFLDLIQLGKTIYGFVVFPHFSFLNRFLRKVRICQKFFFFFIQASHQFLESIFRRHAADCCHCFGNIIQSRRDHFCIFYTILLFLYGIQKTEKIVFPILIKQTA